MNLEKIMTKHIITVNINDLVKDACMKMKEHNIGFLPVEQNKHIVGIITDRDITCRAGSNNLDYDSKIESYMTNNVISIEAEKTPSEALEKMKEEKVKRLLITNQEKIVGIISLSDILKTDIDPKDFIQALQAIFSIHDNCKDTSPEVDQFYL